MTVTALCDGEEDFGDRPASLKFELDGQVAFASFTVGCPICGDGITEVSEQCDGGNGCDAALCVALEGFICTKDENLVSTFVAAP